jgi:hypothetical protein
MPASVNRFLSAVAMADLKRALRAKSCPKSSVEGLSPRRPSVEPTRTSSIVTASAEASGPTLITDVAWAGIERARASAGTAERSVSIVTYEDLSDAA